MTRLGISKARYELDGRQVAAAFLLLPRHPANSRQLRLRFLYLCSLARAGRRLMPGRRGVAAVEMEYGGAGTGGGQTWRPVRILWTDQPPDLSLGLLRPLVGNQRASQL